MGIAEFLEQLGLAVLRQAIEEGRDYSVGHPAQGFDRLVPVYPQIHVDLCEYLRPELVVDVYQVPDFDTVIP